MKKTPQIYKVIVNGTVIKEYPHREQAEAYCLINGYVFEGYDEWNSYEHIVTLDNKVKIEECNVEVDSEGNV